MTFLTLGSVMPIIKPIISKKPKQKHGYLNKRTNKKSKN